MAELKGLRRWFAEKWTNQQNGKTKPCGEYEGKGYPKCRPSKRVSKDTPRTWSELSSKERRKAIADKQKSKEATSKVRFANVKKSLKKS
jgi:predicted NAD/FAD-binding protein